MTPTPNMAEITIRGPSSTEFGGGSVASRSLPAVQRNDRIAAEKNINDLFFKLALRQYMESFETHHESHAAGIERRMRTFHRTYFFVVCIACECYNIPWVHSYKFILPDWLNWLGPGWNQLLSTYFSKFQIGRDTSSSISRSSELWQGIKMLEFELQVDLPQRQSERELR